MSYKLPILIGGSWRNGGTPKYDIRDWAPEHAKMGKGITLSDDELEKLKQLLQKLWLKPKIRMKIAIFIRVFAYAYPLLYGNKQKILFSCIKNEKFRTNSLYYVLSSIQFKYKF